MSRPLVTPAGRLLLCAGALFAAGCFFPNERNDLRIREEVSNGGDEFSLALFQSVGMPMRPGNQVELLDNGAVFEAMEEEIRAARWSIHLISYIWRHSPPSSRLVSAIEARTREGVACRIIYDPFGSVRFETEVRKALANAGCDVRPFRPFGPGQRSKLLNRNHRKILVVDGRVGITGGFGIWWSWLGDGRSPDNWREASVRVRGPVVRDMQYAFSQNWQEAGGPLLGPGDFPELQAEGESRAGFVASRSTFGNTDAERMTQLLIAAAHRRLWIANSYFIPSTAIGDMLIAKAKAGVDVRVLAPGRYHDLWPVRAGQRSTYDRLLENGVRIWEYQLSMMHAKTMLVDDRLAVVGSTNLDPLSMRRNEESSLVVDDPALVAQMERGYLVDLDHSLEIRWDSWRRRGLVEKLSRRLTSLFGEFL